MADIFGRTHSHPPASGGRGEVIKVNAKDCTAVVEMAGKKRGGKAYTTKPLPVAQILTHGARSFAMPRIKQQVFVLFFDDEWDDGVVFSGRYDAADDPPPKETPPLAEKDLFLDVEGGSFIRVTPKDGGADVSAKATGVVNVEVDASLNAKASIVSVKVDEAAVVDSQKGVEVKANNAIQVESNTKVLLGAAKRAATVTLSASSVVIEAPSITLKGAVKIDGPLTATQTVAVTGDATIGGKSFLQHVHTSAAPGVSTLPPT